MKVDLRPNKNFWAPGHYRRVCFECGEEFKGDKRALVCADCAYSEEEEEEVSDGLHQH
jgi:hypothetical protein